MDSVIPLVNVLTFPTTPAAISCTPFTIEAAKSEPGSCGKFGVWDVGRELGADVRMGVVLKPGS